MKTLTNQIMQKTGAQWTAAAVGTIPGPYQIAPITGLDGEWDGGFVIESPNPEVTKKVASLLNGMCFASAAGTSRLKIGLQHEYQQLAVSGPNSGNGGRRR